MLPLEHYRDHHDQAVTYLATALGSGALSLFVGSGISQSIGLPSWPLLVGACAKAAGVPMDPGADLQIIMDSVEHSRGFKEYSDLVRTALYSGVQFTQEIIRERLLIALGALTMPSRRGSVSHVVTLNFDDVLERYWGIHGFTSLVVTQVPAQLRGVDVTIYHPNGYLPSDITKQGSDFLVLSKRSFEQRQAKHGEQWRHAIRDLLTARTALVVGMSGNDPTIGPALQDAKDAVGSARPTAFWMRGPGAELDDAYFLQRNVVPLNFATYAEYPDFIFEICRKAAERATPVAP